MYEKVKRSSDSVRRLALSLWFIFAFLMIFAAVLRVDAQTICDQYPEQAESLRLSFGPECQNPTMVQPDYLPLQPGCMVAFSFPGLGDRVGVITGYKWNMDTLVYEYWILYDFPRPAERWGGGWAASGDVLPLDGENCDTGD